MPFSLKHVSLHWQTSIQQCNFISIFPTMMPDDDNDASVDWAHCLTLLAMLRAADESTTWTTVSWLWPRDLLQLRHICAVCCFFFSTLLHVSSSAVAPKCVYVIFVLRSVILCFLVFLQGCYSVRSEVIFCKLVSFISIFC